MKALIIGDVHGTTHWKKLLPKIKDTDITIFLGDYFDDWNNDWSKVDQIINLQNILDVKRLYDKDKIRVLLGNHDLNSYLMPYGQTISGHQSNKEIDIKEFLEKNLDDFDIACKVGDYVCSHAGFSKNWMKNNAFNDIKTINQCFHDKIWNCFTFTGYNCFGDDPSQGPTWIRPGALYPDMYFKKQIVGHTETELGVHSLKDEHKGKELWIVDQFDHAAYLELEV